MRKLVVILLIAVFAAPLVWFERVVVWNAVTLPLGDACYQLAVRFANGQMPGGISAERSWWCLNRSVAFGSANAMVLLGCILEFGEDFQRYIYDEEREALALGKRNLSWSLPETIKTCCYSHKGGSHRGEWCVGSRELAEEALTLYLKAACQGYEMANDYAKKLEWQLDGHPSRAEMRRRIVEDPAVRLERVLQNRIAREKERCEWELKKKRELKKQVRKEETERARKQLSYPEDAKRRIGVAGYALGDVCTPPRDGCKVVYADVVEEYTPQADIKPFYGLSRLCMRMTSTSHRLFGISACREDIADRADLLKIGCLVLADLGDAFGCKLTPFRFEAPDSPYWPSRRHCCWSGGLPELFKADENQWATSRTVLALSETKIGRATVHVGLTVVDFTECALEVKLHDEQGAALARSEFEEAFKKMHEGTSVSEWNLERRWKTPGIFAENARRASCVQSLSLAGWKLGEQADAKRYPHEFAFERRHARETPVRLDRSELDGFLNLGVATNSGGRVSSVFLSTDDIRNPEDMHQIYRQAKDLLVSKGMDEYYEEEVHSAEEVRTSRSSQSEKGPVYTNFCRLSWVDKSRTVLVAIDTFLLPNGELIMYLSISNDSPEALEGVWRRCLHNSPKEDPHAAP